MATLECGLSRSKRKRTRSGFRHQLELSFPDADTKTSFLQKIESAKDTLKAMKGRPIGNYELLSSLLEKFNMADVSDDMGQDSTVSTVPSTVSSRDDIGVSKSFLGNSGIYEEDGKPENIFLCEECTFVQLAEGLSKKCSCGAVGWLISKLRQIHHVLRVEFTCTVCKLKRWWSSSRVLGGRYIINQKLVHAFTCAGILPTQYINFSRFAKIGFVGKRYINSVYNTRQYIQTVERCTHLSMMEAIDEVKNLPGYDQNGEWVITDARHDSTSNAYHTTVPCLSGSTHKIVGCTTLSKKEHSCAQTRELACTKIVLPKVISKGLNVVEVAHDNSPSIKAYITNDLKLMNSYDTWHGTKNVAKGMTKIAVGAAKFAGKKWFPELSDKRKSTKTHLYYCMKNCNGSPQQLRDSIDNIVSHYQGNHSKCSPDSPCRHSSYSPTKVALTDDKTIEEYTKQLHKSLIYVNAESYCRCRDTYWVESFNHHLLTYLQKRIHFGTATFIMRMNLACMDWNENVGRPYTSERYVQDTRRPDRRTTMKTLVDKSFSFVDTIWVMYVQIHKVDLSPVNENDITNLEDMASLPSTSGEQLVLTLADEEDIFEDGTFVSDDVIEDNY